MKIFQNYISIIGCLMFCACAQVGHSFDIDKVNELKPGISTEADAKQLFGEPMETDTGNNGHQLLVWKYAYGTALATGGGAVLAVSFDAKGRMIKIVKMAKV